MKMSKEHYEVLKSGIAELATLIPSIKELIRLDTRVKDSNKRFMWDCFYATKIQGKYSPQEFPYDNTHIETAMKKILSELGIK